MLDSLVVTFRNKISRSEIPLFRGAIIAAVDDKSKILFHNHDGEGFRYGYPMIQYKRIGGKAAIVCVGNGTEEIGSFFSAGNFMLALGNEKEEQFEIESVNPRRTQVQVWDTSFHYYLRDWLPLNPDNHQKYQSTDSLVERTRLLERILVGNILSACKGLGITINNELSCQITSMENPKKTYYKGLPMMNLSCEFNSNISLPDYIGLGKGASMGHGIIYRQKKKIKVGSINSPNYR